MNMIISLWYNNQYAIYKIYYLSHPETSSRGGLIPEMIQVCDYDTLIVLVELNTLI